MMNGEFESYSLILSLRGTKQSHVERWSCKVRDCFVSRNDKLKQKKER